MMLPSEVIQKYGLAKGVFRDRDGRCCMQGAINLACHHSASTGGRYSLQPDHICEKAIDRVKRYLEQDLSESLDVSDWNDAAERTPAEVVAVLQAIEVAFSWPGVP